MQILELDSGRLSLEFSPDETDSVFAGLRAVAGRAPLSRHAFATHELIGIGPENIILMSDWDEPCLISQTQAGDALLRGSRHTNPPGRGHAPRRASLPRHPVPPRTKSAPPD
jgi:hypothetical protein